MNRQQQQRRHKDVGGSVWTKLVYTKCKLSKSIRNIFAHSIYHIALGVNCCFVQLNLSHFHRFAHWHHHLQHFESVLTLTNGCKIEGTQTKNIIVYHVWTEWSCYLLPTNSKPKICVCVRATTEKQPEKKEILRSELRQEGKLFDEFLIWKKNNFLLLSVVIIRDHEYPNR